MLGTHLCDCECVKDRVFFQLTQVERLSSYSVRVVLLTHQSLLYATKIFDKDVHHKKRKSQRGTLNATN